MQLITNELVSHLLKEFKLEWNGMHGLDHWMRVHDNGLWIATQDENVNTKVVALFGILHDAGRIEEIGDQEHGSRSSRKVEELNGEFFELEKDELDLLIYACLMHPYPIVSYENTVGACWDADRLDLTRTGIKVNPRYLSTDIAKDFIVQKT
ncbi:MAG: hypothetical protein KAS32_04655 [Candidatus Peribacteraceae bacterium]|nr:hypothetical protein [Candidatus Peribacteraceae bacterium]